MNTATQIHEVVRRLASSGDGHRIALEQTFPTTPENLWSACTEPTRLARWFEPAEGDLHESGHYRLTDSGTRGTILHCDSPRSLTITWEYEDDVSLVEVTIAGAEGSATLTLTHSVPENDHWREYGPGAAGAGWDASLLGLALHLADDPRATPEAMATFDATPEGAEFVAASLGAWERAHVDAGADPTVAHEASERAAKAYLQQ
ncbi:SRPBCC family protein [Aeromicrobium alkaliterrae]|uniref:SRPBCC domain-containing protein n=1 Tax=Aeromicrobium alkaliterrae TaxID=302168 RepID=A0ABN2K505_9ACTN